MKKLLLFLFTLLALTPPLSAQTKEHNEQPIYQAATVATGQGDLKPNITGKLVATVFDYQLNQEVSATLIENGVFDTEKASELIGAVYPRELIKLEYTPADGYGDILIVEFDNSDVNVNYASTAVPNFNGKIASILTTYTMGLAPGGRLKMYTKYGGTIKWVAFSLTGTLASTRYSSSRALMSAPRIVMLDDVKFFDVDTKAFISGYNESAKQFNTGGYAAGVGNLIYAYETGTTASPNNGTGHSYVNTFNATYPKYYEIYNSADGNNETINLGAITTSQKYSFLFHTLQVSWTEGDIPAPKVTGADMGIRNGVEDNGVISFSKDVTLKGITTDIDSKAYYAFSTEGPVTDVEISDDNLLSENNPPVFDESGYLTVVGVSTEYGTTGEPKTYRLAKLDVNEFSDIAAVVAAETANVGCVNNRLVLFDSPLYIDGVYNTVDNNKFMYVRDKDGNAIKFVNKGANVFFNENSHYTAGTVIPPYGITGIYNHNDGFPEINVYVSATTDYRAFCADAAAPSDEEKAWIDAYSSTRNAAVTDVDFNRFVSVNNLTWTGANSVFTDAMGAAVQAYGRFSDGDLQDILNGLAAGSSYKVDGYVGQRAGALTLFPTAIKALPATPALSAPNPIAATQQDIENGYITVNVISDKVELNITNPQTGVDYYIAYNGGEKTLLSGTSFILDDAMYADGVCSLTVTSVFDGMECTEPASFRFVKHSASEIASISDFKALYVADGTDIADKYHRLTGKVQVRAITPEYIYVRDLDCPAGEESMHSLLIHNSNGWENEFAAVDENGNVAAAAGLSALTPGDVITNIALLPEKTAMGNLISQNTGYARTVRRVAMTDGNPEMSEVKSVDAADPDFAGFGESDRMVRYVVKNVKVVREDKNTAADEDDRDRYTYYIDIDGNPELNFDVFTVRNGWSTAYSADAVYDLEGVVILNGSTGKYALAFIDYTTGNQTPALAAPAIDGVEDSDPEAPQTFVTTARVVISFADGTAPENAKIYYTLDGTNPLHNIDGRMEYTAPIELTASAIVKAYASVPGAMPSAVVERTFINNTQERRYIVNFLSQGEPDMVYNFTGNVAVAAIGQEYMFVRGAVGHYLPIRLSAAGKSWSDLGYSVGDHLSGFLMRYAEDGKNRMGDVSDECFASWGTPVTPDEGSEIDPAQPDEVTALSDANARRMVHLSSVKITAASAKSASYILTEARGEGKSYSLNSDNLPCDMSAVTGNDADLYDITGFAMYDSEGNLEVWPVSVSRLTPAASVTVTIDGKPAPETYEFRYTASIELACSTPGAVIYYQFYNEESDPEPETWYVYQAGRPIVETNSGRLHAYASAEGYTDGVHTHVNLVRLDQTAAPAISAVEGTESSTVTISAEAGTVISWWTSEDATAKIYTAPITIEATTIVYATAKAEGKVESPVTHKLVKVAGSAAPSDKISGKVNISARLNDEGKPVVTIAPADENLTPGSYTIYYTLKEGVVLTPENGTEYTGEFTMEESGLVTAILVESGKSAGEPCYLNVWAGVTGIDGISGAEGESEVRVDGDSIIAPQGSEVYDLSGRRVNSTGLAGGIYIVRIPGGKAVKVKID